MQQQKQQRIKEIDKQIITISIIETPGSIMFGVGIYSKFVGKGEAILPFLQDDTMVNSIIVIGAAIILWGTYKILMLKQEKARLQKSAQ